MSIGSRLKRLRENDGRTQDEMARAMKRHGLNTNRVQIARWENDTQLPRLHPVSLLAKLYNVSIDYIVNGDARLAPKKHPLPSNVRRTIGAMNKLNDQGQLRVAEYSEDLVTSERFIRVEEPEAEYTTLYTPYSAAAGAGAYNETRYSDEMDGKIVWSNEVPKHDGTIEVTGDSMFPSILSGDIAFTTSNFDKVDGAVYVVNIGDETVIKRCYFSSNCLELHSDNEAYPVRTITDTDLEDVRVAGRVVGWTTPL